MMQRLCVSASSACIATLIILCFAPLPAFADYAYIRVYSANVSNVKPTLMDIFNLKSTQVITTLVVAQGQTEEVHVDFSPSIDRQFYFDQLLMLLANGYNKLGPAGIYQYVGVLETPSPETKLPSSPSPETLPPSTSLPATPIPRSPPPSPEPSTSADNAFYALLLPNTTEALMLARLVAVLNTSMASVNVFARGTVNVSQSILFTEIPGAPQVVTLVYVNFTISGNNWSRAVLSFDGLTEQFLVSLGVAYGVSYAMTSFYQVPVFSCQLFNVDNTSFRIALATFLNVTVNTVLIISSGPVLNTTNMTINTTNMTQLTNSTNKTVILVHFTFVGNLSSQAVVRLLLADSTSLLTIGVMDLRIVIPAATPAGPPDATVAPATMMPATVLPATVTPRTSPPATSSPATVAPSSPAPTSASGNNAFYVILLPNTTEAQFVVNLAAVLNTATSVVRILAHGTVNVSQRILFVDLPQLPQTLELYFANFTFDGSDAATLAASCDALSTQKLVSIGVAFGISYYISPSTPTRNPNIPLFSCRLVNSSVSVFQVNVARLVNVSSDKVLIVDIRVDSVSASLSSTSAVLASRARKLTESSAGSYWLVNFSFVGDSAALAAARLLALPVVALSAIGVERLAIVIPAATTAIPSLSPATFVPLVPTTVLSTSVAPSQATSTSAPRTSTPAPSSSSPPVTDNSVNLGLAIGLPVGIAVVMLCFGSCWCWRMQQQTRMQYQGGDFSSMSYPQNAQQQWGPPLEMQMQSFGPPLPTSFGPPPPPGGFSQQTTSYTWQQRQQQQVIHPTSSTLNAQQDMQVQRIEQQIPFSYPTS